MILKMSLTYLKCLQRSCTSEVATILGNNPHGYYNNRIRLCQAPMKIRFYKRLDGMRWLGFVLAMIGTYILSNANPNTQWVGWAIATMSCTIWIYMGIKDKDTPRALMELMYLLLALRAIYNWIM